MLSLRVLPRRVLRAPGADEELYMRRTSITLFAVVILDDHGGVSARRDLFGLQGAVGW